MRRCLVLSLIGFAAYVTSPALAGEQRDVVILQNGDRITGKVKGLQDGVLRFDLDYVDGAISIDWNKVVRLESSTLFIVRLTDGSLHTGKLTSALKGSDHPELQISEDHQPPLVVADSDVVHITPTSESLLNRFSGSVSGGTQYSKGNRTLQYSIGSTLDYRETNWGAGVNYGGTLSSSSGAQASTRNEGNLLAYRLLHWQNYFYAGSAAFLQSSVQGIQRQTNIGAGIGRYLKNTNHTRLAIIGGFGWQGTHYVPAAGAEQSQNLAVGLILANFDLFTFKKTRLSVNATLAPALTETRDFATLNSSYYLKLFGKIDWTFSVYGNWDTKPPTHLQSSDYGTTVGLSYTFGNR